MTKRQTRATARGTTRADDTSANAPTRRRQPASKYGAVGDVICVPLKRTLFAFVQILEMRSKQSGIVGLFPIVSSACRGAGVESMELAPDQFQIELTGLAWEHWKVVGHRDAPVPAPRRDRGTSPCFVAEVDFVAALKALGALQSHFRLYRDIQASHPKLRPGHVEQLSTTMRFLDEHDLLSEEGRREIATGTVPPDFSMTSDSLTPTGAQFYDLVFKKDYVRAYFLNDTYNKLVAEWEAFRNR